MADSKSSVAIDSGLEVAGVLILEPRKEPHECAIACELSVSRKLPIPTSVLMARDGPIQWRRVSDATRSNLSIVVDQKSRPSMAQGSVASLGDAIALSLLPAVLRAIY